MKKTYIQIDQNGTATLRDDCAGNCTLYTGINAVWHGWALRTADGRLTWAGWLTDKGEYDLVEQLEEAIAYPPVWVDCTGAEENEVLAWAATV